LEMLTGIADDTTMSAAAVLATFKNISGANFTKTLTLAQDLSVLKDMGLESAVTALGKALNEPAEGLSKLSKLGIQFTDEQERMIKKLAGSGDAAGAQAVMLKALEETFGGVAASTQTTTERLTAAVGRLSEEVGKVLLPFVDALAVSVIPFMDQWGHEIAVVSVAVTVLIATLTALTIAQKAVAIGQALILSLAGPAGWTALALGAAAFALAVTGIELAFDGLTDAAREAQVATENFNNALPEAEADIGFDFGDDAKFDGGKEFGNWDAFNQKLQSMQDEFEVLTGKATEFDHTIRDLQLGGMTDENAAKLRELHEQIELEKEIAKLNKESEQFQEQVRKDAEQIRKSVRTPEEQFAEESARLNEFFAAGKIDEETFNRALAKSREDIFGKPEESKPAGAVAAAQKGSSEAMSAIFTAMRGGDNVQQKQLSALEDIAQHTEELALQRNSGSTVELLAGSLA
jgi:hypothetical protein